MLKNLHCICNHSGIYALYTKPRGQFKISPYPGSLLKPSKFANSPGLKTQHPVSTQTYTLCVGFRDLSEAKIPRPITKPRIPACRIDFGVV